MLDVRNNVTSPTTAVIMEAKILEAIFDHPFCPFHQALRWQLIGRCAINRAALAGHVRWVEFLAI